MSKTIMMKKIIVIGFLFFSSQSYCQISRTDITKKKDSLTIVFVNQISIPSAKAESLSTVLFSASSEMGKIVADKKMTREEKLKQMKAIAATRDKQIESLLSAAQIVKLKQIMAEYKTKMKENRPKPN